MSPESLAWLAEIGAEREIPLHIHLSETEREVSDCRDAHGKRPAAYLDDLGFLGERSVLAHGVWLDRGELELIAERGATVVANPAANMKLAVGGVLPYPAAAAAGAAIGLGTDGVSSNSNLDMFEEVKLFALSQKHASGDPATLPAAEALAIARGLRSPVLGWHGARGRRSPPTSCFSAARTPSSPPVTRTPTSSTRPGARWSTPTVVAGRGADARPPGCRRRRDRRRGPRPRASASPDSVSRRANPGSLSRSAEKAGHYESFYLKLVQPGGGRGAWIRHTVHKRPGEDATCALWFVLFDSSAAGPRATKRQFGADELSAGPDTYIRIADASLTDGRASGRVDTAALEASWDLSFADSHEPFHHLPRDFLYRSKLPKTKFLSPYPDAVFNGELEVGGERIEVDGTGAG